METSNSHEELTSEQTQLEIARLQTHRAELEAKKVEAQATQDREQEETRQFNANETFRAALGKTGIRFYIEDTDDLKKVLARHYTLTPSRTGDSYRVLDSNGKQVELEKALENIAVSHPFLVLSGAEHLRPRDESGAYATVVKDDFGKHNYAAKSRWISEHPGEWDALPQHRTAKVVATEMNASQYMRLPSSEKSKIISEIGEIGVAQILRRKI